MNSDDDFSDEEGPKFSDEMGAFLRAGFTEFAGQDKILLNPVDKFRIKVNAVARNLSEWDSIYLSNGAIRMILEKVLQLQDVEYKNATAYVLGYVATEGGQKLTSKGFKWVVNKLLPHVEDKSVLEPDIIRYARLWENI